ncbi:MAG: helix-turn-helix transcriptional regulator [Clostridia bacterium]|nr:helix-turn-helix transcriptional regulator [Clostridia bacterium]
MGVMDVAMKSGFSDASHFIAAFHQRFGVTPNQYRLRMTDAKLTKGNAWLKSE